MALRELTEQYKKAVADAESIRAPYANSDKEMTEDEVKAFDAHLEEADKLWERIEREKAFAKVSERVEDREPEAKMAHPVGADAKKSVDDGEVKKLQQKAIAFYVKGGKHDPSYLNTMAELKTFQADLDDRGGYLVAPQFFVNDLLKDLDNATVMRQLARVWPVMNNESLGVPTLDSDFDDADWTSELATGGETTATFGKRELRPHPLAKRVKISNKLMRASVMDMEAFIRERLAYKFGITLEKAYMTGDGNEKPLGIFVASTEGIPSSRDVVAGTTTKPSADGLIDVKHTLRAGYQANALWLMHRDVLREIRKLKDGNGQYLWQPGIQADLPGTILESRYVLSEYAPNALTTGTYYAMYADFSKYWIVDNLNLTLQRLDELYAEQNVTGFIGRAETDGAPVLAEAFVRATLA